MGRPKGSQNSQEAQKNMARKRALELAAEYLELDSVEELKEQLTVETPADKIWEAQSVFEYFNTVNKNAWYYKECESCHKEFKYNWYIEGVACCSISCMRKKLQAIGLDWNPDREAGDRWGRTVPAIVPPDALSAIESLQHLQSDSPEDHNNNTTPELS